MKNKKRLLVYLLCASLAAPNLTVYAEPNTQTKDEVVTDIASDTDASTDTIEEIPIENEVNNESTENDDNNESTDIEEVIENDTTNNESTEDLELEVQTHFVGSPAPEDPLNNETQSNIIIESIEDWDNFIARNDDFWKNGTYVGHAENISITINADISSIIQDIIIRPSGEIEYEYNKTKDITVNDTKTYYINTGDETTPVWTIVDTPVDTDLATYYEKIEHNIYNDNVNLTITGIGTISDNLKIVNDYGSLTISNLTIESSVLDINSINNITINTVTFNNSNLYVNSNSTNPVYNITGSNFIGSSGVYNATTFNNPSYTSASITPKFTINFTNCTCEALANSIYNNFVNNKLGGSVDININGFIGTCTDNFYYLDNGATIISDLQNIEITNLDDTNTKTAIDIESAHKLKSIKNCTINNFYRGIYTPIYNIVNSETNKEEFVIYDNITINNCVQGINIGEYGCPWAHISNCTIIGKDTNLTNNSSYGIRYKTSPGEGWDPSALITAIEENNLDDIYSVTNCNISKVYNGIDLNALNGGIIRNCNITNIINGIDSGSVDRLCILDCVFTSADTEIHNYGLGQFNGGWAAIDCDFTGFYTGINHTIGGTGNIIGCTFTNNKKYGLYSYCDYVEDCVFTGNTETFIMTTSASGFKDIQITGNGTVNEETGKSNRNGTNIGISLGTANCIFEDDSNNLPSLMGNINNCSLTTYKYDYYKLSDRNLTNNKTIITNCKTGVLGSGGTNYIVNIEISNCDIGCDDATSNQYKLGNIHINDCNKGIVSSDFRCGAYKENDNQVMLIENCDIGAEISNYSTENYYSGENYTIHFKSNDIGLKQTGTWVNHNALFFDSNRIGADLTNSMHPGTIPSIKLKDNTEVGIKLNNSTKSSTYFQITNGSKLLVDEDGSEPISLWLNTAIMMNSDVTYTGQGKIYLDNEYSYLYKYGTYVPENMPGTIEFDVKDALYKNGTIVATSGTTDYEWVNQLSAKKNGWIVTIVPPALWSDKKDFETPLDNWNTTRNGNMGFELSEGCVVTYDYATNGGTSVSGVPIGNSNYIDGGSIFDIMYETGKYWQTGYYPTSDIEPISGKKYYIKDNDEYIECDYTEAFNSGKTIYQYNVYTDEALADIRQSFVNDTTSYPIAQNVSANKYNYKKGKSIDLVTPVATKSDWTFVGWNTDPDATTGLTELTADQTNITLYAIYSKNVDVTYHTFDNTKDWSKTLTVYNNTEFPYASKTDSYKTESISPNYLFIGYVLDENETDLVNNLIPVNGDIEVPETGLDIYCVYSKTGTLTYKDYDDSTIDTIENVIKAITASIIDMTYSYIVANYTPEAGYSFNGWSDGVDGHDLIQPGAEYVIADNEAVLKADRSEIMITSLALSPKTASKKVGDDQQYTVEITPTNALNKDIVWTSSNENVATIDTNGKATVVGVGTTTITAKNNNSNKSDTATLMGVGVTVSPKTATLLVNDTQDLTATVLPEEANQDITWTSSNDEVATVSENGKVTALKSGTVTITATNEATGASDTATITINDLHLTYNYAYNGGTSMTDVTETAYKPNDNADLTPIATKDGYTFIGWNTNKDATTALESLVFERTDLTVYAIFKKEVTLTYHTYDDTYTQNLVVYNNADLNAKYLAYAGGTDYTFEGYNLSATTISNDLIQPNDDITDFITDIYCVYSKQGTLSYYNTDEQLIEPVDNNTQTAIADAIINKNFTYTVKDYTDVSNDKIFTGWIDKVDTTKYKKNDTYITTNADAKLYATVNVADTDAPTISVNDTYKVSITAGDITNDELDKIYYRLSETDVWKVYTSIFPVYGRFTIYAYQTTKNRNLESDITTYTGVEYATDITAVYNGDDVYVGDSVVKSDIVVTAHYPNSDDKVITNYTIEDDVIHNVGDNTLTIKWTEYPDDNNCPELTTTVNVNGIEAATNKPIITISDDYKVTLTAGTITNDTLDKIYYRINEGTWKEYTTAFPVYKVFKVEAYQTTNIKHLESEIAAKEGVEYASSISAEYLGDDKFLQEEVTKPEVKVTVHYPNSPDEETTNFNLTNTIITKVGDNTVNVSYNEYPNDENSPTLTTTVIVKGKKAITEDPIITISDDYKVTITPGAVTNDTLDKLYYRINEGEWKEYTTRFPVYKVFKVESYQITKNRHIKSNIVSKEGVEYAIGITAQYLGEDKYLREKVNKSEVKVTVHYPNSEDKVVTDFNLYNDTITKEGNNKVGVGYNEYPDDANSPELTATINVIGKEASTDTPTVKVSKDYKVTITSGKVTNDTLDKIYYKVNDGDWTEYTNEFPVYKTFWIQTYQTTKLRGIESEIVKVVGNEYPDSITAEYTGEPKPIGTKVKKSEVKVIVHYPNSKDEETTDFTLPDPVIKKPGINDIPVEFLAYPEDPDCPTVTTTVPVPAKDEEELRSVLVKGTLKYSDGTPIANKTIVLSNYEDPSDMTIPSPMVASSINDDLEVEQTKETLVKSVFEYKTTTDANGYYEFKNVYVGDYTLSLYDNTTKLGECKVTVSNTTKKDKVEVTDSKDDVTVSFDISDDIIDISALLNVENPEPAKVETPKTPTTSTQITTVKTGDNSPITTIFILMTISLLGMMSLLIFKKKRR